MRMKPIVVMGAVALGLTALSSCSSRGPTVRLACAIADRVVEETDLSLRQVPYRDSAAAAKGMPERLISVFAVRPDAVYRRESYAEWTYANGTLLLSMLGLSSATGDAEYGDFVRRVCDFTLANLELCKRQYEEIRADRGANYRIFRRSMLDDTGGPVLPYVELLPGSKDERLRGLVEETARYVSSGQVRLADGTLCRPEPASFTIWADDLFMSLPFLVRMGEQTGERRYFDDAATQVVNFNRYLEDGASGLYRHGYFAFKKERSPVVWGRANGWIVWAHTEVLMHMPRTHPSYPAVVEIFRRHMKALVAVQGRSGLWHQVLNRPDSFEETSCTAMFMIGLARGIRMGLLDESYRAPLQKAWEGLRTRISDDGVVKDICRGTGISEDVSFYYARERFDNDPRGLGAVITALTEADGLVQ